MGALYFFRMNPSTPRRPLRAVSLSWAWALCLALALRALVPAGTMLDFEGRGGVFPGLILCQVQNPALPVGGHHHTDDLPQSHASPLCLLTQHAGGPPLAMAAPALIPAVAAGAVAMLVTVVVAPMQRVRGAPVGSRAPPPLFI